MSGFNACEECGSNLSASPYYLAGLKKRHMWVDGFKPTGKICSKCGLYSDYWPQNIRSHIASEMQSGNLTQNEAARLVTSTFCAVPPPLQSEILEDIFGNKVRVSSTSKDDRNRRLQSGQVVTCYHQTSEDAAKSIISSQTFRPGTEGIAGGGMYFAVKPEETQIKTHNFGPILECKVKLGNNRGLPYDGDKSFLDTKCTDGFERCLKVGVDSVSIPRTSGLEYVVYSRDQVYDIKYYIEEGYIMTTNHFHHNPVALQRLARADSGASNSRSSRDLLSAFMKLPNEFNC